MSLSRWDEGSDSDHVTDLNLDNLLVGHGKFLGWQWAKLPRSGREGAVEVRPFTAKKRLIVSEAQGLSGEAMIGNPPTTVIPGVDESKSRSSSNRRLDGTLDNVATCLCAKGSGQRCTRASCSSLAYGSIVLGPKSNGKSAALNNSGNGFDPPSARARW